MKTGLGFKSFNEWLQWRKAGIGSSDAAAIMGCSPWSSPFEKFLEKTGRIAGRVRSRWEWKAMHRGLKLEPLARRSYEQWTGVLMPAKAIVHPEFPFLRATCDGINFEIGRALEIKAPGRADHKLALQGKMPAYYLWQCVHILMVSGFEWIHYWSYRNQRGVPVILGRDRKLEERLLEAELRFWNCVQRDDPSSLYFPQNVVHLFKE